MLQIYTGRDSWENWGEIPAGGRTVGRGEVTAKDHPLWTMAPKHLRLSFSQSALVVEDLGSLNGVFRRITSPEEIADGTRFRIGRHVLEFHTAGPVEPVQPQRSDDQEEFACRDLGSLAFLHVLRPDGSCGLIFPLTKESTVIGRETRGDPARDLAAITLSGDKSTSKIHARIVRHDDRFYLEDLGSTDGTYIQTVGRQHLAPGAELRVGLVRLRVIAVSYNQVS
jgi:pSer/pThr/pTyr-binding forkhead associated (FHA) protein